MEKPSKDKGSHATSRRPVHHDTWDSQQSVQSDNNAATFSKLSLADKKRIQLARALIYDPEILVINSPTTFFDKDEHEFILSVLRAFVNNRGLGENPSTRHLRRPSQSRAPQLENPNSVSAR